MSRRNGASIVLWHCPFQWSLPVAPAFLNTIPWSTLAIHRELACFYSPGLLPVTEDTPQASTSWQGMTVSCCGACLGGGKCRGNVNMKWQSLGKRAPCRYLS